MESNQYRTELDECRAFLFRKPAGVRRGDWFTYVERKRVFDKSTSHWNKTRPFQMTSDPNHAYRRDPHYTGFWNPVMWSDYPKTPASEVPLPKMGIDMASVQPMLSHPPCLTPPTHHISEASYPTWFPDLPCSTPTQPHCSPYLNELNKLPFAQSWKCP